MDDKKQIELTSVAKGASTISPPITLRENTMFRIVFYPKIVNNSNEPELFLNGVIVLQKKSKSDKWEDAEPMRSAIEINKPVKISLNTEEVFKLVSTLQSYYNSFSSESGGDYDRYFKYDGTAESIHKFIMSSQKYQIMRMMNKTLYDEKEKTIQIFSKYLSNPTENAIDIGELMTFFEGQPADVINQLLKILSIASSEDVRTAMANISSNSIELLRNNVNLATLYDAKKYFEDHLDRDDDEHVWQKYFEENSWILSYILSFPYVFFEKQMYTGGTKIDNKGGNIVDFAYKNQIDNNIALIEIKKSETKLVSDKTYRNNVYNIDPDVTGAVGQVLQDRYNLMTHYHDLLYNSNKHGPEYIFRVFDPKCVVVVGNLDKIKNDVDKCHSFNNYRNSLKDVVIITYDEMLCKINNLIELITTPKQEIVCDEDAT